MRQGTGQLCSVWSIDVSQMLFCHCHHFLEITCDQMVEDMMERFGGDLPSPGDPCNVEELFGEPVGFKHHPHL